MLLRFALAALISLGLVVVVLAGVQLVWRGADAELPISARARADCMHGLGEQPSEYPRGGPIGWNVASWLIGFGLVATVAGRKYEQPALD